MLSILFPGRKYNERTATTFNFLEYPTDLCLLRNVTLTHETVRDWEQRFAPYLTNQLKRRRQGKCSTRWHVDETRQLFHKQTTMNENISLAQGRAHFLQSVTVFQQLFMSCMAVDAKRRVKAAA